MIYRPPLLVLLGKMKSKPTLGMLIHQDAGKVLFDSDKIFADAVAAIDISQKMFELIVSNCSLIFLKELPLRRIGEGIANKTNGETRVDPEAGREGNQTEPKR